MVTEKTVSIDHRFRGPPDSANGGYTAGLLATVLSGTIEVRLEHPPPLDKPLRLIAEGDRARLQDGDLIIASARPGRIADTPPPPPDLATALEASKRYPGFEQHSYPSCYVCGPERTPADGGLRIFPGPVRHGGIVAAAWLPAMELARDDGNVEPIYLWAALDCPSCFGALGEASLPILLGTITVALHGQLPVGEPCIVTGWPIRKEGRKHIAGSAIWRQDGDCVAESRAIWIALRPAGQHGAKVPA